MKPTSHKIWITGFAAALAMLAGIASINWHYLAHMEEMAKAVAHSEKAHTELHALLLTVADIETGQRGFLLTGEPAFLEPLENGVKSLPDQLRGLETLLLDAEKKASLAAIEPVIAEQVATALAVVRTRQSPGLETAIQEFQTHNGKQMTDRIREKIATMDMRALTLLDERSARARHAARTIREYTLGGTAMSLVLLSLVFGLLLRQNRLRRDAEVQRDGYFNIAIDMLSIESPDGYFRQINPAFSQTLGWTTEEMLARPFIEFVHPDDRAATLAEMQKLAAGQPTLDFENRYQCKDGSWKTLAWRSMPEPGGMLYSSARDMTEIKAAADALRISEERLAVTLHSIGDGVLATDTEGRITELNSVAEMLTGWTRAQALGRPVREVLRIISEETRLPAVIPVDQVLATGEVQGPANHTAIIARDGTERSIADSAAPIHDRTGRILGVVLVFRDVTAIQRLNAELHQRADDLEAANKELESFSYSISHDLRAPLRHIHGYIEMLKANQGQLSEKSVRYMKVISDASQEMSQLIDDLLAFSRMGRAGMRETAVDLDLMVRQTLHSLEMATRDRNIVWKISPLPPGMGDPAMLKQVFSNLIGNAVKYTRHRDPAEIEIGCDGEENGHPILFVRDNGAGFNMRYAHKLFGVFQRLHRAEEFEGTGIGLASVRRILTRHGNRIWAEGEVQKGATFYFTLKSATPSHHSPKN